MKLAVEIYFLHTKAVAWAQALVDGFGLACISRKPKL
jgi:hypothetical protein